MTKHTRSKVTEGTTQVRNASTGEIKYVGKVRDFGENLIWFLDELANADNEMIETGDIEIEVVNSNGVEGFTTISIQDLALSASAEIVRLETRIKEMELIND